ncbi:MAG: hypothetical protein Q9195_003350 [Heterodermia aff. obscurata]
MSNMSKGWRLIEPKSDLVYRVRGLPAECNEETLKTGIDDAFSLREEGSPVRIHSLAASTNSVSEKTATISSPALARRLTAPSEEWIFEVPSQSLTSCLEDHAQARVIIDTHFQGFTALYTPPAEEHVVDCVAISGLNFHAFNSFKARGMDHMWLRDDLPKDLSGARILLYGYDVKISDTDSFQDLEGLASAFRSLGGLLLKEALIHMSRDPDARAQTFSEASATHGRPGENEAHDIQAINSTHSEMVKFGIGDPRYQLVVGFLKDFIATAPTIVEARSHQSNNPDYVEPSGDLTKWLAPRSYECSHYQDDLHAALSSRHPNTCQWIYRKSVFQQWLSSEKGSQAALLWLHAIPGAGKTVLSSYAIDNFLSESYLDASQNEQETFYFFFNNADSEKNTPLAAARALVHQLLRSAKVRNKRRLIEELETVQRNSGQSRALNFQTLWLFFASQCKHLTRPTLVLDALDECEQVHVFLSDLHALVEHGSVNIFATSRREAEIIKFLDGVQDLAMSPEKVHDDINAYLKDEVSLSWGFSNAFVRSRIMHICRGIFLWVELMLEELKSEQTVMKIKDVLVKSKLVKSKL